MPGKRKGKIEITPHPEWAQQFWDELVPLKDRIVGHTFFQAVGAAELPLERCRTALVSFYRLVENFPKYMSLNLAKTAPGEKPGHYESKRWLIHNTYLEMLHADLWRDWAIGFGCTDDELDKVSPSPAQDAINHYLWSVNTYGSLVEGIGATNLAIEWPTGEWTKQLLPSAKYYDERGIAEISPRTMAWLEAHASYDDEHPYEAMELIKRCAVTDEDRQKALAATKRGMEYYLLALDDCVAAN